MALSRSRHLRCAHRARLVFLAGALVWLALAAGCASAPDAAPPPAPTPVRTPALPPRPPAPLPPSTESVLKAFELQQREAARSAARQGHWADAQWAWDIVLALDPGDAEAAAQRAAAKAAGAAAVAERLPRAQLAQQRGEWESAARLYLEVLAIDPAQSAAADALREIERVRTRRGPTSSTRNLYAAPAPATARGPARTTVPAAAPGADINDVEHASMLADQGDLEAAIVMLRPLATGPRAAPATQRLLASFYFRQASKLEATDRAGAIKALELGLALDPAHRTAAARLKLLRPAAPAASPAR